MDQTLACTLLLSCMSGTVSKYVYIQEYKTWSQAQEHCRLFYTDLAPVSNEHDMRKLQELSGYTYVPIWIGAQRSSTDRDVWLWSGGGVVSKFFWAPGEPDNRPTENYGVMMYNKWHDSGDYYFDPFFCYNVVVVREKKTWEEALDHCREHHRDLASVASETEMLLIQRELQKNVTTERVWIGLHFFPGQWLWVDGQPLEYEAWGQEGKPACPPFELECAALQVMGGTAGRNASVANSGLGVEGASCGVDTPAATDVKEGLWEPHDCEEKLHFVCY